MFIQTYTATSPFNPHQEMDKTFLPSYSSSLITSVEAEVVEFSCFHFHRKRTTSTSLVMLLVFKPLTHTMTHVLEAEYSLEVNFEV